MRSFSVSIKAYAVLLLRRPFSILLTGLFAYLPTFFIPILSSDEAGWGTMSRYIFSGRFYEMISDNKPPLHFQIHWLASLGETSLFSIKLFLLLWTCWGGFGLYRCLKSFCDHRASLMAAHLFVLFSGVVNYGAYSGERIVTPLCIWATFLSLSYLSQSQHDSKLKLLVIGALLGAAFQVKQTSLFLSIPSLWVLALSCKKIYPLFQRLSLLFLGAFILTFISWALVGVSPALIWREAFEMNFIYVGVHQAMSKEALFDLLGNVTLVLGFEYLPLVFAASTVIISNYRRISLNREGNLLKPSILLALTLISSVAALAVGGRFYQQYFSVLLPSLAITAAFYKGRWPAKKAFATWSIVTVFSLHCFTAYRQFSDSNRNWNSQIVKLIDDIRTDTKPNETIWISNSIYSAYWLIPRAPAVRYLYLLQILNYVDPCRASDSQLVENSNNLNFQLLMKDLQTNAPAIIFWTQHPRNNCSHRLRLEHFPTISNFIRNNYDLYSESQLGLYFKRRAPLKNASEKF